MISIFTRQALRVRQGAYGQAVVLLLTTLTAILSVVFAAVYVAHLGGEKIASANAVDAIALSAATWEARGLNMIAALNDGIEQCFRLIRWTSVVWAAMAIAALTGLSLPAFLEYSKQAARIIRSSWNTARQFAMWAEKVKDALPYLILAETALLARNLKVTGALYPFDPRGPHDQERTLTLHLTHGPPLTLVDALSPIHNVKRKISKWKWAKKIAGKVIGIIDSVLGSVPGSDKGPIFMLIPEEHFPQRQKVRFTGSRAVSPIPVPLLPAPSKNRFLFEAAAEPYGGGAKEMSWKSRFTEWRREK
ncbi:MAG TPA: hypothetical protein VJ307_10835 [Candidatus Deferrimicrobiaceae bacterium]|jgi:hypothetical protein|nr:hypothetical protein [Candidatus Deferrimicrobiaceae bacterium]